MAEARRRIAIVTDAIAPYNRGGKEQRYQELAPRLAADADVHVYTMNWWRADRIRMDSGVTYHALCPYVPLYSGRRRSIRQALVFAISTLRLLFADFDVIEADSMPYVQLPALKFVALLRRRRLVVTWHEYWGPAYWRAYLGPAGLLGWMFESLAMKLADIIIADTPQTGERLVALGRSRVVVIPPIGIDLGLIRSVRPDGDGPVLITVGRLLAHKRIDLFIEAVREMRDRGRAVTAQVVGVGPELESLRALAARLGVTDLIQFRQDVIGQRALYTLVKSARVAVFPSEREGFGIAVLEALACGIPVVATSAPDNLARFLVSRSETGIVCEPSVAALTDAIETTLNRNLAREAAPPDWIGEYDWDTISASVMRVLG